jgi:mRNA-degrading endonuclease RelE of RelBE toxin-antitoxin system
VRYEIIKAPEVDQDLKRLSAHVRAEVSDAIEIHLRHEPTKTSKSRIKRLRGLSRPQYRLRVGEVRVFYDVEGRSVQILAVVSKPDAARWLEKVGKQS